MSLINKEIDHDRAISTVNSLFFIKFNKEQKSGSSEKWTLFWGSRYFRGGGGGGGATFGIRRKVRKLTLQYLSCRPRARGEHGAQVTRDGLDTNPARDSCSALASCQVSPATKKLIAIFIPVLGQYWMSEYQRKLEVVIWKDTNRIRAKKEVFSRS